MPPITGMVCFSTMIRPRWVLVNTDGDVSPASRSIAVIGEVSEQVALVRSQPAKASSATL